jgi:tRNA modification GTPase
MPAPDTIAALATAPGRGALALVRVSGPFALGVCDALFRGRSPLAGTAGGRAKTGWIIRGGEELDQVVATVFRSPKSFTGEDLVEISCHGGRSAGYVLEALVDAGARPAEPGEFTKRAFLNGRLDLTQAEAVAAIVDSSGRAAQRASLRLLKGALRERLEPVYTEVIGLHARTEAGIEFPEDLEENGARLREGFLADEAGGRMDRILGLEEVEGVRDRVRGIGEQAGRSDLLESGLRCVFSGPVNVGKSSLFNRLLGRDRAIVTVEPGTTRDVLEGAIEIDGVSVTLVDTAGLRDSTSLSEEEGTRRALAERESADLILEVRDGSRDAGRQRPFPGGETGVPVVAVLNKADLGIHRSWSRGGAIEVSAAECRGMGDLLRAIGIHLDAAPSQEILLTLRQRGALERAERSLDAAADALRGGGLPEIVSFELAEASRALGGILGREPTEGMLDAIFSRFCIGK